MWMLDTNICIYVIAAHAMSLDRTLISNNEKEFRRVPGLKVENWAQPV